jgi:hypothetical protein
MATRYRPPTPRELAEDEWKIDHARGRKHCPVHRTQQMMPLAAGLDVCPLPHGQDESPASGTTLLPAAHQSRR